MSSKSIHIGTSGWHYPHWKGIFYTGDLAGKSLLSYYAGHFETTEINNTFYRLPESNTFKTWHNAVPEGFVFAVKASRYITHRKRLNDPLPPIKLLLERAEGLGNKLGPVLFQLPPHWNLNLERLMAFLKELPHETRFTIEFRDPTWFDERVYRALTKNNVAFCIYDFDRRQSPRMVTADFTYIRLHGPGSPYTGKYSRETLADWAEAFSAWHGEGKEIYCYFDNDEAGYAAQNALELKKMLAAD